MEPDFPNWLTHEIIQELRADYVEDIRQQTPRISASVNREPQKPSPYGQHESYVASVYAGPSASWISVEWTTGGYSRGNRWELKLPVEDILFLAAWILKNRPTLRARSAWEMKTQTRVRAAAQEAGVPRERFNEFSLAQQIVDFIEAPSVSDKVSSISRWKKRKK